MSEIATVQWGFEADRLRLSVPTAWREEAEKRDEELKALTASMLKSRRLDQPFKELVRDQPLAADRPPAESVPASLTTETFLVNAAYVATAARRAGTLASYDDLYRVLAGYGTPQVQENPQYADPRLVINIFGGEANKPDMFIGGWLRLPAGIPDNRLEDSARWRMHDMSRQLVGGNCRLVPDDEIRVGVRNGTDEGRLVLAVGKRNRVYTTEPYNGPGTERVNFYGRVPKEEGLVYFTGLVALSHAERVPKATSELPEADQ